MSNTASQASLPIDIDDDLADLINHAHTNGKPITVAYVDAKGQPHLSFRGSTQAHGRDKLAIWIRDRDGGLLAALPNNDHMTLLYRDHEKRVTYFFYGRAHIVNDEATASVIYENSPEDERGRDPERGGVAVVIDLDVVQGGTPDRRVTMRRA